MEARFGKLEATRYWEKIPLLKVRSTAAPQRAPLAPCPRRARLADRAGCRAPRRVPSREQAGGTPLEGVYGARGVSRVIPPPPSTEPITRTGGPSVALDKKKKKVRSSFCSIL
jgi:hypothetical protein